MENRIKKNIDEHGVMIVADFTTKTKIRFKYLLNRTIGGMYILEGENMELDNGKVESEIINTWDFEEVKKWCMEAIIHKNSNK